MILRGGTAEFQRVSNSNSACLDPSNQEYELHLEVQAVTMLAPSHWM